MSGYLYEFIAQGRSGRLYFDKHKHEVENESRTMCRVPCDDPGCGNSDQRSKLLQHFLK